MRARAHELILVVVLLCEALDHGVENGGGDGNGSTDSGGLKGGHGIETGEEEGRIEGYASDGGVVSGNPTGGGLGGITNGAGSSIVIEKEEDEQSVSVRKQVNFASQNSGAMLLESSSAMKGAEALLEDNKDKYAISPCHEKRWIVVGLSEDILLKEIVLAHYEKYSSTTKTVVVYGSQTYPVEEWMKLGTYDIPPGRGEYTVPMQEQVYVRYLKLKFTEHHDQEFYCTLSQIKVHGSTMLQSIKEVLGKEQERNDTNEEEGGSRKDEGKEQHLPPTTETGGGTTGVHENGLQPPMNGQQHHGKDSSSKIEEGLRSMNGETVKKTSPISDVHATNGEGNDISSSSNEEVQEGASRRTSQGLAEPHQESQEDKERLNEHDQDMARRDQIDGNDLAENDILWEEFVHEDRDISEEKTGYEDVMADDEIAFRHETVTGSFPDPSQEHQVFHHQSLDDFVLDEYEYLNGGRARRRSADGSKVVNHDLLSSCPMFMSYERYRSYRGEVDESSPFSPSGSFSQTKMYSAQSKMLMSQFGMLFTDLSKRLRDYRDENAILASYIDEIIQPCMYHLAAKLYEAHHAVEDMMVVQRDEMREMKDDLRRLYLFLTISSSLWVLISIGCWWFCGSNGIYKSAAPESNTRRHDPLEFPKVDKNHID